MEENKKFKLVSSKKTRYSSKYLTLEEFVLGISSIKFSIDGNYSLAVIYFICSYIRCIRWKNCKIN